MGTGADTLFTKQYSDNVLLLATQSDARLRNAVINETQEGEYKFFNQLGSYSFTTITGAAMDTVLAESAHYRRRVGVADYQLAPYLDKYDTIRMGLIDPQSAYTKGAAAAVNKQIDDVIIAAFDGTAYTGVLGGTSTSYDTDNDITISGAMTLAALLNAKQILDENEVPDDGFRYLAVGSADLVSMLSVEQITSADYNTTMALVDGRLPSYLGFQIIRSERLGTTDGARNIFFWHRDSMLFSMADFEVTISQRADKQNLTQLYHRLSCGATRMQEEGVGRILRTT